MRDASVTSTTAGRGTPLQLCTAPSTPNYLHLHVCVIVCVAFATHLTAPYGMAYYDRAVGRKQEGEGRGAVGTAPEAVVGSPWLGETEGGDEDSDEWGEDEGLEERDSEASKLLPAFIVSFRFIDNVSVGRQASRQASGRCGSAVLCCN